MASLSLPSRARSADRLSSSRFISRASGHAFANAASIGAMECLRAWIRAMRGDVGIERYYLVDLVPRTRRNAEYCAAEPGPIVAAGSRLCAAALHAAARPGHERRLLERDRVHQAALAPEAVEAALELERARLADIALVDLAVIAGGLEGRDQPFVVDPEPRAEIAGGTQQALDRGRLRLRHLVDIALCDAKLFGLDQAVMQPGDDVAPDLVAIAGEGAERLLADGLWQHDVVGRVRRRGRHGACERGSVLGHGVATAAEEGLVHGVDAVEHQRLPVDAVGAAVIAERDLMRGALRDADGGALEILNLLHAELFLHDKALPVVEVDWTLPQAQRDAAQIGLRRVAVEHVDLAGLERGKAVLRGQRDVTHLAGIAEHAGGERAAIIDVETLVVALRIRRGEAGKTGADAAYQRAAALHRVERCRRRDHRRCREHAGYDNHFPHHAILSSVIDTTQYVVDGGAELVDDQVDLVSRNDIGRRQQHVVATDTVHCAAAG